MSYRTLPMPSRFRAAFDEAVRRAGGSVERAQERMREMMRDEFPDNGVPVGGCVCSTTWDILLVWKETR